MKKYSDIKVFFLLYSLKIVYVWGVGRLVLWMNPQAFSSVLKDENIFLVLLTVVFVSPLVETMFFQVIIGELLKRFKIRQLGIIGLSGLFFALAHSSTLYHMFMSLFPGMLYMYYYLFNKQKGKGWLFASLLVFLLHSLYNLTLFIVDFMSNM